MKHILLGSAMSILALSACNNGNTQKSSEQKTEIATTPQPASTYTPPAGVDANVSASIKGIVDGYLQLKNALTVDNGKDAGSAGAKILAAMDKVDTAAMSPAQRKTYGSIADDVKEHAAHISKNTGKIAHQRTHFEMLSKDIEDLVKTFGGGQTLYKDFCPMAFDGKGANWLSELKDIKNPYFGSDMLECGEVKETFK